MASTYFKNFDRTQRRIRMLNLIEQIENERSDSFRASLVVNGRTGQPLSAANATHRGGALSSQA